MAIPLVAVFGHALPEAVDRVIGTWRNPEALAFSETAAEAPLFDPLVGSGPPVSTEPPHFVPDSISQRSVELPSHGSLECDTEGCRVLPAAYEAPMESRPDRHFTAAASPHSSPGAFSGSASPGRPAGQSPDPFESICRRLKELGSTYVLLESWGDGQEQFRFYCKIAIAGNPHYTYRFEATSPDPLGAMSNVLRQVESWHAGRYGN